MTIFVRVERIGVALHRLLMVKDGTPIGEYERSKVADIDRKTAEIQAAETTLLALFQKHGELVVRWDGLSREKVIRSNGQKIGVVPRDAWGIPNWRR